MTFTKSALTAILPLVFIAGLSSNATAGGVNLPFKATLTTLEYLQPTALFPGSGCDPFPLSAISIGVGNASYLGRVAVVATDCVAPFENQFVFQRGRIVFTAANGDSLVASYQGAFVPVSYPTYTLNGATFTIVGGTGRFKKATGGGELHGTEQISADPAVPSRGALEATGTISY
jgi:hypothetical protein